MPKKLKDEISKGEIIIYKSKEGPKLEVRLQEDTVWLDAHLMAKLFKVDRTVVVKHIRNIYNSDELFENSTCAKIAQVAADGKVRKMNLYNLDMIISVGYRVNSQRATQFRIWATITLRDHLVKGYTINEKRILETQEKFKKLTEAIEFLKDKFTPELLDGLNSKYRSPAFHQLQILFFHIIRKKTNLYNVFPITPLRINFIYHLRNYCVI
jgi:hypothetical protein